MKSGGEVCATLEVAIEFLRCCRCITLPDSSCNTCLRWQLLGEGRCLRNNHVCDRVGEV